MTRWNSFRGWSGRGSKPAIPVSGTSENKYRNTKVEYNGEVFDSKKELRRYQQLELMEKAGEIRNLRKQVKYVLIPAQREPDVIGKRGGIKKGRVIERECAYMADFVYEDAKTGETVVEDVKSDITRTTEYRIKRKLMLFVHHIRIKEI